MNLDDRMRRSFQDQMDDVRQRVDTEASLAKLVDPGPRRSNRLLAAAAAILLIGGGIVAIRNLTSTSGPMVEVEAGTAEESTTVTTAKKVPLSVTPAEPAITGRPEAETTTTAAAATNEDGDGSSEAPATTRTTTIDPDPTPQVQENGVCQSGFRAPLESAQLRYVGENQGWGRLFDLVDEQDGPFYFQAWEPGYPDPVTVEVELAVPVEATEIRVAQDPFTPVDGSIFISAAGQDIVLELEGTEGWKVHRFDELPMLDRFTIRREAATSNIMEVLVCVAPPG